MTSQNNYSQLYTQAKSAYSRAEPGTGPAPAAPARPSGTHGKQPSLLKSLLKHLSIITGLIALTILILYWQTIFNEVGYWWRHLQNPPAQTENVNALYPGNYASYQIKKTEHPTSPIIPPDDRLVIDKIEVNAPIVYPENSGDESILKAIEQGIAHYPESALPGEPGNVFLTAHSSYWWWDPGEYKFVFQHLEDLVIGDVVTVYYHQKRYDYKVRSMDVIKPKGEEAEHVFDQDPYENDPILTLMTCVPVGTSLNRLIVRAEQIYPEPDFTEAGGTTDFDLPEINVIGT